MKKGVIISSIKEAKEIKNWVDAFLIPLKDLSINYTSTFTIEEIKQVQKLNKETFVIINKNIENKELNKLEETLKELEKINLQGIIFYDIAIVELKKEFNLKTDLVWHQEHLATNYSSVNYWYEKGAKYAYLSSEITKNEIEEIRKKTKAKLMINVYGYIPMFTSKRHLVDNYIDTFNLKEKGNVIYKEEKNYNIKDEKNGTTVYTDYILNIKENINVDYYIYNSNMIDEEEFKQVLINNNQKEETGFLYKETIYKVK